MVNDEILSYLKELLGYNEAQWETWMSNPRNLKVAEHTMEIPKYKVVFEVIKSEGCAAGHKVGDRIIYGGGTLLCRESPEKICFGLLSQINPVASAVPEKICLGEDPTKIAFNKIHCFDVGLDNGGWGEVIVEVKVEKNE